MNDALTALNRRLDDAGWGLFLAMIGVLWLVPEQIVPKGTWMVGAGLILIGVNTIRYAKHIPVNGFSTTLGVLAMTAGLASIARIDVPLFPLCLIAVGVYIVIRTLMPPRTEPHHA